MQQARKIPHVNRVPSPAQPGGAPGVSSQPGKRLKKAKLLGIMAACFILSLVVVAQYSSLVVLNYQLSSARSELNSVRESSRTTEIEAARLGSLDRIESIAREELGMVEPGMEQLNTISASQRVESEPSISTSQRVDPENNRPGE